jgi:2-polyprenyl-3-methyl-5-hydroxy-6-metoxy-1,4-benzoquinol methylase
MKCYVCDGSNLHSMGSIHSKSEIVVCKTCGNVMHRVDVTKEEDLKNFYRTEYRPAPNHMNLLTTTHKRVYIARFLNDFISERDPKKTGKAMICGDVGCATGYIPAWLRGLGHKATGSELTITYRRFAEAFYGIPIPEELEKKHKYDLITIYHVLEHLIEPDKKLSMYRDMMSDDGRIMVSTPEWFDVLEEASGSNMQSFEDLFHKNHINVFSAISLKNLFAKVGLEIVKEDHVQYGQTYLLKKCEPSALKVTEQWEAQVEKIEKIKKAIGLHVSGKHELALEVWRRFPEAWIALAHGKESKDPERQADIFSRALAVLSDNMRLLMAYSTWLYMREQIGEALKVYKVIEQSKPNETLLIFMGYCYGKMGKFKEAAKCFYDASEMAPTKWSECMDQICAIAVNQPCWEERALNAISEEVLKKAKQEGKVPELVDPAMSQENKTSI